MSPPPLCHPIIINLTKAGSRYLFFFALLRGREPPPALRPAPTDGPYQLEPSRRPRMCLGYPDGNAILVGNLGPTRWGVNPLRRRSGGSLKPYARNGARDRQSVTRRRLCVLL